MLFSLVRNSVFNTRLFQTSSPAMAMRRRDHCRHYHHLSTLTAFTFLIFFFFSASATALSHLGSTEERRSGLRHLRPFERQVVGERRITGPGSSPPTCRSKCGSCYPCKPVHVPIQPGLSVPLEYYPEAWRCKCGNNLFMP